MSRSCGIYHGNSKGTCSNNHQTNYYKPTFLLQWFALNEFYLNDCQPKEVIVYVMFVAVLIVVLTLFYNGNLKPGNLFSIPSLCTNWIILGFMTDFSKIFFDDCQGKRASAYGDKKPL